MFQEGRRPETTARAAGGVGWLLHGKQDKTSQDKASRSPCVPFGVKTVAAHDPPFLLVDTAPAARGRKPCLARLLSAAKRNSPYRALARAGPNGIGTNVVSVAVAACRFFFSAGRAGCFYRPCGVFVLACVVRWRERFDSLSRWAVTSSRSSSSPLGRGVVAFPFCVISVFGLRPFGSVRSFGRLCTL